MSNPETKSTGTTLSGDGAASGSVGRLVRPVQTHWAVEQDGVEVASGSAPTTEVATREATRYAIQYGQDGPVKWIVKRKGKILLKGSLAGVSITIRPNTQVSYPDGKPRPAEEKDSKTNLNPDDSAGRG